MGFRSVLFVLGLSAGEVVVPPALGSVASIRTLVFDRYGAAVGELDAHVDRVKWRLNKTGSAKVAVAKTDGKATRDFLRFGNRVLMQFDNGLPDWGGVIVPPRGWDVGKVELTVRGAAEVLDGRMTDSSRTFVTTPAGTIFRTLIEEANAVLDTGIDVGTVWAGGAERSPATYHYDRLLPKVRALATLTGNDFAIVPVLSGGVLRFEASWYERRGADRPNVALVEGHNVEVTRFQEVGPIVNHWAGFGEGATWGDKPKAEDSDLVSRGEYGLWQNGRAFTGVVYEETLEGNLAELLSESKAPRVRVGLWASDIAPARFRDYGVGDRVELRLHSYGFSGAGLGYEATVRVVEREFSPATNRCALVVEVEA